CVQNLGYVVRWRTLGTGLLGEDDPGCRKTNRHSYPTTSPPPYLRRRTTGHASAASALPERCGEASAATSTNRSAPRNAEACRPDHVAATRCPAAALAARRAG